ncbi:excisionase [Dickeya undicola]|uniref:Excisionase n=1 Tax=Dickeya undicola TaxID=1577887 RepID=A0A3N0G3Q1_9GAMM|nr:excisionase [Dickeya undicola]RNM06906.1 excisionase [Dickeya undicola]
MTKLLTLEEWCARNYSDKPPTIQTLQRWARSGRIYPVPEKHGREYRVTENAIYINPKDFSLAKKIVQDPALSPLMEKVIHGHGKAPKKV